MMPHEIALGELYIPPLLLVVVVAYALASFVFFIGGKLGLYRLIAFPIIAELCLMVIIVNALNKYIPIF
ncbi:DUF1656 domain-containing protein [Photobacterium kagoshimensis]|uniref:DUF1656 domain-containing protein n=1 Tax=Photobacterium kagoshimensis TaxID=2910242 RepID=UPI003D12C5A2